MQVFHRPFVFGLEDGQNPTSWPLRYTPQPKQGLIEGYPELIWALFWVGGRMAGGSAVHYD